MFFIKDIFLKNKQILKSQAIPRAGLINISGPHKKALFRLLASKKNECCQNNLFLNSGKEASPTFLVFDLSSHFYAFFQSIKNEPDALEKLRSHGFVGSPEKFLSFQDTKNKMAVLKYLVTEKKPDYLLINFLKRQNEQHYFEIMNALYTLPGSRGIILVVPESLEKTIGFLADISTIEKIIPSKKRRIPLEEKPFFKKLKASAPVVFLQNFYGSPLTIDFSQSKKKILLSFFKGEAKRMVTLSILSIIASLFLGLSVVSVDDRRVSILSHEVLEAAQLSPDKKILGEVRSAHYPTDNFALSESLVSTTQEEYGFQADDFETRMYFVSSPSETFSPLLLPNPLDTNESLPANVVTIPYISRYVSYLGIYLLNEPAWDNMNNPGYPVYISRPYANLYLSHLGLTMYSELTGLTFQSEVNDGFSVQNLVFTIAGVVLTPENYYANTLSFYDRLLGDYYVFLSSNFKDLFGGKRIFFELGTQKTESQEVLESISDFTRAYPDYDFHFLERDVNGDFEDGALTEIKQKTFAYFDSSSSFFLALMFCILFLAIFTLFALLSRFSNALLTRNRSSQLDDLYLVSSTIAIIFVSVPISALLFRFLELPISASVEIPLNNPIALLVVSFFFLIVFVAHNSPIFRRKMVKARQ